MDFTHLESVVPNYVTSGSGTIDTGPLTIRIIFDIRALDLVWVMTQGGPGKATEVWASWLYRTAQVFNEPGTGAALGVPTT